MAAVFTAVMRRLPFARSTTTLQAATYLLGISLFSISFLVFLNSSVSFVITDLIGVKTGVGDIVGTLGFADELVALVACPFWGLVSDRLGVRLVAVIGYSVIGLSLLLFVQATNVYPQLLLARILFAIGATASATMVTAILPPLTDESDASLGNDDNEDPDAAFKPTTNPRNSIALSHESELTITPERFAAQCRSANPVAAEEHHPSTDGTEDDNTREKDEAAATAAAKPSVLAGLVGLSTGCGALVALFLFLPMPVRFGQIEGTTSAQAVSYSFYLVGAVAFLVALFVSTGLRSIKGEEGKGWRLLLGLQEPAEDASTSPFGSAGLEAAACRNSSRPSSRDRYLPYGQLLRDSIRLGFTDSQIGLGYLGGFVARASTVAISLFIPLFINTFFIRNDFCQGSPNDPSPELKKECRAAYLLASILTGVAQLMGLICAPFFGYLASRTNARLRSSRQGQDQGRVLLNYPVIVAALFGIIGYIVFPRLPSPEIKDVDGRGGSPAVFLVAALVGISQIGTIVCSLGSLGSGVLTADLPQSSSNGADTAPHSDDLTPFSGNSDEDDDAILNGGMRRRQSGMSSVAVAEADEGSPLLNGSRCEATVAAAAATAQAVGSPQTAVSRVRLKGSIAGVYSWCGGVAILLLTKLGGYLFDSWSPGAPFYMMALFNGILLCATVAVDVSRLVK